MGRKEMRKVIGQVMREKLMSRSGEVASGEEN
jgi:hypothetical protein